MAVDQELIISAEINQIGGRVHAEHNSPKGLTHQDEKGLKSKF